MLGLWLLLNIYLYIIYDYLSSCRLSFIFLMDVGEFGPSENLCNVRVSCSKRNEFGLLKFPALIVFRYVF